MNKRIGIGFLVGIVAILGVISLYWKFDHRSSQPLKGTSIPEDKNVMAEGRLVACPDAEVRLRSEYAGVIEDYPAREHVIVRKGDLLASIKAEDVAARLEMAQARLRLIEARYEFANKQLQRAMRLKRAKAFSRQSFDRAKKNFDMALARKEQGEATVRLYQFILSKTRIIAPIKGVIVERRHNRGEYVRVGARLVTIADLDRTRIDAEIDEFDAGQVHLSDLVMIRAEGDSRKWKGIVVGIGERVSRKHLVPDDPSRPTDTGVVHVKIAPTGHLPFKLGQKVTVKIETINHLTGQASPNKIVGRDCGREHP